jgi:hypothetical protein
MPQAEMDAGYRGLAKTHPGQVSVPPLKPRKDAAALDWKPNPVTIWVMQPR